MTNNIKLHNANYKDSQTHELRLIAVAPLPCMETSSSDDNVNSIATQFNSQHHVNFMEEVFKMLNFGINMKDWTICHLPSIDAL